MFERAQSLQNATFQPGRLLYLLMLRNSLSGRVRLHWLQRRATYRSLSIVAQALMMPRTTGEDVVNRNVRPVGLICPKCHASTVVSAWLMVPSERDRSALNVS